MCQIQVLYKLKSNLNENDLEEFYKLMCYGSLHNNDAWGIFNSKFSMKKSGGFNKSLIKSDLKDKFIVGHNRLTTSGENLSNDGLGIVWNTAPFPINYFTKKRQEQINHHPFILNDLVLVHNGIISNASSLRKEYNIKSRIQTDSYVILYLIDYYLNKNDKTDRTDKIINAIQRTTRRIDGSYSVILYDKKTMNLFYFKNFQTDFNFKITNDVLIGSTMENNLDYVYFGSLKKPVEIRENHIYLINKTNILKDLGEFKEKPLFFNRRQKSEIEKFFHKTLGYIPNYKFNKLGDILIKKDKEIIKKLNKYTDIIVGNKYIRIPVNNIEMKGGGWLGWF